MKHNNTNNNSYGFALFLIGCLFFIFGFITWSNSQLIPYLKIACELSDTQSYLVATAFFAAYFVMSIPSAAVLRKTGFKRGMSLGLFVMAIGALLFIPAAQSRNYPLFLTGLFIIGSGLALLQTASNPYVTVLGPIESAAQRISIMGICNKVAGILAVLILGSITLKNVDELKTRLLTLEPLEKAAGLDVLASRVITPYIIIAISLSVLAIALSFVHLPEIKEEEENTDTQYSKQKTSVLQFPHLLLGAMAIFFYVGVEVISYDTFTGLGESLGFKLEVAKTFASYTGYGLLLGYFLSIAAIPKFISQRKALIAAVILSIVLVIGTVTLSGYQAVVCFALLGFSNSVMWPAIWPLSLQHLGRFTKTGGALLVMGIVGGAVLPPLYGKITEWTGSRQAAYLLMIPCYLYILYFAVKGYAVRDKTVAGKV
ncbi:sugar MFS transporter [Taibaiella chishuiensis]|uniref:Glucose/galactose transporter n=1 Tax=Taibaiella chishuiensis TaxID=1434707 RepID=A0A2P8D074_9BACT|nr:sugar MFS transporter [Taibaiella chishuiensis]PSK90610.1 glucose/galactose transporter [Taibaiella chishuiensis]